MREAVRARTPVRGPVNNAGIAAIGGFMEKDSAATSRALFQTNTYGMLLRRRHRQRALGRKLDQPSDAGRVRC